MKDNVGVIMSGHSPWATTDPCNLDVACDVEILGLTPSNVNYLTLFLQKASLFYGLTPTGAMPYALNNPA